MADGAVQHNAEEVVIVDRRRSSPRTPLPTVVADRTRDLLGELSPGERKVARALLATYPVAGLETVAELAQRAQVSAPTVLRFAARLGFDGYPAFQQALMREVQEQMGSPLRRMDREQEPDDGTARLSSASRAYVASVKETFSQFPEAEFERAVELLVNKRLTVRLLGGRFSEVLATYLANHLVLIRRGVSMVPTGSLQRSSTLLDLTKRDLLVVFDYRRYDKDVVDFAWAASQKGATVLLFTDQLLSPISNVAAVVLPAQVEAYGPFDTLAPAMAIVETLVAAVNEGVEGNAVKRIQALERATTPPKDG